VLPAGGKPLGIFPDPVVARSLVERRLELRPAEGLLLFTDGLVEGFDPAGRMLGLDPVTDRLRAAGGATSARIVADLVADLHRHCADRGPSDDLTLIVVRREPAAAPVPSGRRS
jgi:serine phosphatase RsbU (regulator of sigma subunit)